MRQNLIRLALASGILLPTSPLSAQVLAKTRPTLNLTKLQAAKEAFNGDPQILGRFAQVFGLFCPLNAQAEEVLKSSGLSEENRALLLAKCWHIKNVFPFLKADEDEASFKEGLKRGLRAGEAALVEDPATGRALYSAGIGPVWEDMEDVGLRVGNARLGMTLSFNENSPELRAHWVHPQRLIRVPLEKHLMSGTTDVYESLLKLEALPQPKAKKAESGLGGLFSKALKAVDVTDMALMAEFPIPQLYVKQGTEFSVRFRSREATPGMAVFLIPLQDQSETNTTPAFPWYHGKKGHPPNTTLFQKPYQTRIYQEARLAGMYGVMANYPNGVRAGNYLAVLAPPQRPDEAKQAFVLSVFEDKPASGVSLPAWW